MKWSMMMMIMITIMLSWGIVENLNYLRIINKAKYNEDKVIVYNGIMIRNKCFVKSVNGEVREGEYKDNKCNNKENIKYDKSVNKEYN